MTTDKLKTRVGDGSTATAFFRPTIPMRRSGENPRSSDCKLHLRRICGVCTHFGGAKIQAVGGCIDRKVRVHGLSSGVDCASWSRKSAAPRGGA